MGVGNKLLSLPVSISSLGRGEQTFLSVRALIVTRKEQPQVIKSFAISIVALFVLLDYWINVCDFRFVTLSSLVDSWIYVCDLHPAVFCFFVSEVACANKLEVNTKRSDDNLSSNCCRVFHRRRRVIGGVDQLLEISPADVLAWKGIDAFPTKYSATK